MTDRCETCGWMGSETTSRMVGGERMRYQVPVCRRGPAKFHQEDTGWPVLRPEEDWCGEHTAVQRRRDRLMLAGQAMTGLVLHSSRSTTELSGELAAVAFALADAVLERADAR